MAGYYCFKFLFYLWDFNFTLYVKSTTKEQLCLSMDSLTRTGYISRWTVALQLISWSKDDVQYNIIPASDADGEWLDPESVSSWAGIKPRTSSTKGQCTKPVLPFYLLLLNETLRCPCYKYTMLQSHLVENGSKSVCEQQKPRSVC